MSKKRKQPPPRADREPRVIKVPGGWMLPGSPTVYRYNPLVPADKSDPFPPPPTDAPPAPDKRK